MNNKKSKRMMRKTKEKPVKKMKQEEQYEVSDQEVDPALMKEEMEICKKCQEEFDQILEKKRTQKTEMPKKKEKMTAKMEQKVTKKLDMDAHKAQTKMPRMKPNKTEEKQTVQ